MDMYHALSQYATDMVAILNAEGIFRYASPSYQRILGYQPADLPGTTIFERVHPEDVAPARQAFLSARQDTGAPVTTMFRLRHATGSWRVIEATVSNQLADPAVHGIVVNSRDITTHRRVETDLARLLRREHQARAQAERAKAQLQAVLDVLPVGVIIADARGTLLASNDASRAIWDETPLVGGVDEYRVYRAWWPETGRPVESEEWALARTLRTGEVCTGEEVLIETFRGNRKVILNHAAPIRDEAGAIVGAVVAILDITVRKRLEQRTQESLAALLAMAGALVGDQAVAAPAADGLGLEAAAADGLGLEAPVVGGRLAELTRSVLECQHVAILSIDPGTEHLRPIAIAGFSPEHAPRWWRQWERRPRLSDRLDAAHITRLHAGDALLLDRTQPPFSSATAFGRRMVLMVPLRIANVLTGILSLDHGDAHHEYTADEIALARAVGRLAALVIERERLLRERAEARGTELALREANRRMDEFLGIAGHEMRTPLTTISGNIQIARRRLTRLVADHDAPGPDLSIGLEAIQRLLERTSTQTVRLNRLVDDLLDVSRIQAGRLEIRRALCDLAAIVRDIVHEQRQIVPTRAIWLELGSAEIVLVLADADRIGQVIANYLSNALKYSPPDRAVTVGLTREETVVRVWVRDDGPGLDAAEQERVWDRFYQVEGIGHRHGSSVGLGLGLHISRTIIEQHHGQVGVESAPGRGATFWFTLPVAPAESSLDES